MSVIYLDPAGTRLRWEDDATRKVYTYAPDGATVTKTEPYTAEQNAAADAAAAAALEQTNRRTIEAALGDFTELDAIIATANGAFTTNTLGAAVKVLARAIRRVSRLLIRRFDGTT